jgi:site-specific recombinase XerD
VKRWGSTHFRAAKPFNSTTVQKYYRSLSVLFGWLINEELLTYNPLLKIKVPRAEKKVIKALSYEEVSKIITSFTNTFEGKRNKAIFLVLVDCGLRLGELLSLTMDNLNMEQQLLKVPSKARVQVHPHLLRHTFATLWLKNGGYSLMLQKLLGHTTL